MFKNFRDYVNDPIEAMFIRLAEDQYPDKIDLGIGVFRDAFGNVPVMDVVRQAESRLIARGLPKSYLSPLGNHDYCRDIERLVLGGNHTVLQTSRIVSAQTPGAGSALRLGAALIHSLSPHSVVWVSEPTWPHQVEFFEVAGLEIRSYRYYDQAKGFLDIEGMLEDLWEMQRDDIILLHGCCHNPTGQDLDIAQWKLVADAVNRTGALPFVDVAYQGFGEGIEEDVAGARLMIESVPEMLLAVSSSKSFGIYRERAGMLSVMVGSEAGDIVSLGAKMRDMARQLYFMAPDHGAAIVHEILSDSELEALWRKELDGIRQHVCEKRKALRTTIEAANPGFDASFIERQHGMFSCLPITEEEQVFLEKQYHIYMLPDARVNVAAMLGNQSETLAAAFADVRAKRVHRVSA